MQNEMRLLFNLVFVRGVIDRQALAGIFGIPGQFWQYDAHFCKVRKYSIDPLPDFCANCLHDFGTTVGGRARLGCTMCRVEAGIDSEVNKRIGIWTCFTQDWTDYQLAKCYKEYFHGRD